MNEAEKKRFVAGITRMASRAEVEETWEGLDTLLEKEIEKQKIRENKSHAASQAVKNKQKETKRDNYGITRTLNIDNDQNLVMHPVDARPVVKGTA